MFYSGDASALWIEYKFIEVPKRLTTIVAPLKLLDPLQQQWIGGRRAEGRAVWVVIGSKNGGVVLDDDWGVAMETAEFIKRLESRAHLAQRILAKVVQCSTYSSWSRA